MWPAPRSQMSAFSTTSEGAAMKLNGTHTSLPHLQPHNLIQTLHLDFPLLPSRWGLVAMSRTLLPLSITWYDVTNPCRRTLERLWAAWELDQTTPDQRDKAFQEITTFAARLDPYDSDHWPKLPRDRELFQAHMAQAFRHARAMMFSLVPRLLSQLGSKHNEMELEELLRWCKSRPGRTVVDAVRSASAKKELGNQHVAGNDYIEAVWTGLLGLVTLCPWSSDATIMSFDQAGEVGLRQIEQALLLNIVIASQKAAVARKKAAKTWVAISIAAITSLEQHPFATWGNVVKRLRLQAECIKKHRSLWSPPAVKDFEKRRHLVDVWSEMPHEGWAHEQCEGGHRCYGM
ncbi:hypothetical protein DB88DRAFT_489652, partial [Papiliotrema laurentii]